MLLAATNEQTCSDEGVHQPYSLNIKTALGPDGISSRILHECTSSSYLPTPFNLSLSTGINPHLHRIITPVYRSGDPTVASYCYPIFLL